MNKTILRPTAEQRYKEELDALRLWDQDNRKPENWLLSPKAVRLFILGSRTPLDCGGQKIAIQKKYLGNDALVERCIITLAGNRGLMLVGEPAVRAAQCGHQRVQHQHGAGHGGHHRGDDQIWLELCAAAGQRPQPGGPGAGAPLCGDGKGHPDPV